MIEVALGNAMMLAALMLSEPPKSPAPPRAPAASHAAAEHRQLIARRRAKKFAIYQDTARKEAQRGRAEQRAMEAAEARAERLLPYQLEAHRLAQQAQRDAEWATYLRRSASSLERISGFRTPGNSSYGVLPPQIAPHMAGP